MPAGLSTPYLRGTANWWSWIQKRTARTRSISRQEQPETLFRHVSQNPSWRRCTGATSICGEIHPTIPPIRTIRCSTARAAYGKIPRPWNVLRQGRGTVENVLYQGDTAGGARGARGAAQAAGSLDPKLDTMVSYNLYSVVPSPVDSAVWGASEEFPGYLVRMERGNDAPMSCKTLVFKIPEPGFDPRGVDVDSNGVVWTALAASSHLASYDFRKCKDVNGTAKPDGSQCREGWTLYETDGPKLKGTQVPADFHYYDWVDQHNISRSV